MIRPALLLASWLLVLPAIRDARGHLAKHQLDDVLFDLDGKHFSGADAREAAAVLGKAALESRADALMSLQFAQMALKLDAAQEDALEAGARAAFVQKQFDLAEPYADRWVSASHRGARACLLRSEIAVEEGDWQVAAEVAPEPQRLAGSERERALKVRAQARRELSEKKDGLSAAKGLDHALQVAMDRAAAQPRAARVLASSEGVRASERVVVYGTSWCGFCKAARNWFTSHHVPFEDKDVEKDEGAVTELAEKAEAAHIHPRGVPVLDVHGTLIAGFDIPKIKEALR